jgi:hypothetical protein
MNNIEIPAAPVLLITFNRPDYTIQVFDKIRQAKVKKLYISNDGPREGNIEDQKARKEIKKIIDSIDWDCDVHTLFQEKNLGCGIGVSTAITWAFENEDRMIILEDDCVPSLSFFDYCSHCLEKYKNDTRVWLINGRSHHQGSKFFNDSDYIFSHYSHCWGWATWKRVWEGFNINMPNNDKFMEQGGFDNVYFSMKEARFFNKHYSRLFQNNNLIKHSWAYPFSYYVSSNRGLSIVPAKNMIKNVGLYGVHSSGTRTFVHKLEICESFSFDKEPLFVLPNRKYDYYHYKNHMKKIIGKAPIYRRVISKIRKLWKKLWIN